VTCNGVKPMTQLRFSHRTLADCSCPVCGAPLIDDIWTVRRDVAFCPGCADSELYAFKSQRIRVWMALRDATMPQHWSTRNGIRFWCPQAPFRGRPIVYVLHREDLNALLPDASLP
jgi:hypothetical protein